MGQGLGRKIKGQFLLLPPRSFPFLPSWEGLGVGCLLFPTLTHKTFSANPILDISNNKKSNQLSHRNYQFFLSTTYCLLPLFWRCLFRQLYKVINIWIKEIILGLAHWQILDIFSKRMYRIINLYNNSPICSHFRAVFYVFILK